MAGVPNLTHLMRAMLAGDVIYVPETDKVNNRQVTAVAFRNGAEVETANFLATNLHPETAHRIVRITMVRPFGSKPYVRGAVPGRKPAARKVKT